MKRFNILWQGKLIAEVMDYNEGFIDSLEDINREIEVVEIAGIDEKILLSPKANLTRVIERKR